MAAGCMLIAVPNITTTRPCLYAYYPKIFVNGGSRGYGMGHWGYLRYIYMASARDQGCDYGNHFGLSFGLDDRCCDPYCDKVL